MDRYELATEDYLSHREQWPHGCGCYACNTRLATQGHRDAQAQAQDAIKALDALELRRVRLELRRAARLERGLS